MHVKMNSKFNKIPELDVLNIYKEKAKDMQARSKTAALDILIDKWQVRSYQWQILKVS